MHTTKTGTEQPLINPYLAVVMGVVAAAFSSIFTKLAQAPPMIIAFYRLLFTLFILAPFVLRAGVRRELRAMTPAQWGWAAVAGVFLALHFTTWITSLNYTSVASSTVLVTLQPLFVVTIGWLVLKEKVEQRALAGAGLAITGSVLIGISDFRIGGEALWGDILAFAGAGFVAGYVLIGRRLRHQLSLLPYVFVVYSVTALVLGVGSLLLGYSFYPYDRFTFLMFAALALVPTILGHTVFNWALRFVPAAVVSVSILGEPVGATILAYFIFAEVPTLLQLTGGLIIIWGVALFIIATMGGQGRSRPPCCSSAPAEE